MMLTTNQSISVVDCQDPPSEPDNGSLEKTTTTFGSNVTYSCQTGYLLQGNSIITCLADGQWSGGSPDCLCENKNTLLLLYNNLIGLKYH